MSKAAVAIAVVVSACAMGGSQQQQQQVDASHADGPTVHDATNVTGDAKQFHDAPVSVLDAFVPKDAALTGEGGICADNTTCAATLCLFRLRVHSWDTCRHEHLLAELGLDRVTIAAMRVVGAVVMAVVGACGFSPGSANAIEPDAAMGHADGSATGSDAGTTQTGPSCYGNGLLNVCFDDPLPAQFVPSPTLLTDDDGTCTKVVTVGTRTLCVVAAQTIELASDLRATGNRPLVLIAATTLTLDAGFTIDVASRDGSNTGAGGNDAACVAPSTPEGDTGGGGGGAGGSFGGKGGDGGIGDGNNNGGFDGTAAPGIATDAVTPTVVRGGCKGGVAGGDSPNNAGRAGGSSGGAVYLIAGTVLTINGTIDASGAGGQASNTEPRRTGRWLGRDDRVRCAADRLHRQHLRERWRRCRRWHEQRER